MYIIDNEPNNHVDLVNRLKQDHPKGTEIVLISTNTFYTKVSRGQKGKVLFVDDAGGVHVDFNGQTLVLVYNCGDKWEIKYNFDWVKKFVGGLFTIFVSAVIFYFTFCYHDGIMH